jgi:hypothetical protein
LGRKIQDFSDAEALVGVSYAKRRFHFAIDHNYLRKYANLALVKNHENYRRLIPDILKEILQGVDYSERKAYFVGICKMFSERSTFHRGKISA